MIPVPKTSPTYANGSFFKYRYKSPDSKAPHILPGNARRVPIPRRLRIRLAINAAASPHHGPTSTAHKIFTRCCTGVHFAPNTGKENRLPTTATAAKSAATVNLRMFTFELFSSIACAAFSTIRQIMIVMTISGRVFPTGVSTCMSAR